MSPGFGGEDGGADFAFVSRFSRRGGEMDARRISRGFDGGGVGADVDFRVSVFQRGRGGGARSMALGFCSGEGGTDAYGASLSWLSREGGGGEGGGTRGSWLWDSVMETMEMGGADTSVGPACNRRRSTVERDGMFSCKITASRVW